LCTALCMSQCRLFVISFGISHPTVRPGLLLRVKIERRVKREREYGKNGKVRKKRTNQVENKARREVKGSNRYKE